MVSDVIDAWGYRISAVIVAWVKGLNVIVAWVKRVSDILVAW